MERRLPPGDYYAVVARAEKRPDAEVYAWPIQHPLPVLPIPLRRPDADVMLDLARVFTLSYDRGRYEHIMRYGTPLLTGLPIDAEARSWAESVVRAVSSNLMTGPQDRSLGRQSVHGLGGIRVIGPRAEGFRDSGTLPLQDDRRALLGSGQVHVDVRLIRRKSAGLEEDLYAPAGDAPSEDEPPQAG